MNIQDVINSFPNRIRLRLRPVFFRKGSVVIRKGDPVEHGYFFISGKYDVIENDWTEKRFIICKSSDSPFCCLMDIYSNHTLQCATIIAIDDCIGYQLEKKYCLELLESPCKFQSYLISTWAKIFYDTTNNMNRYPIYRTQHKLIDFILKHKCNIDGLIKFSISRDDLAAMMGCSKRTLFRILRSLKEKELIATSGQIIMVYPENVEKLQEEANNYI